MLCPRCGRTVGERSRLCASCEATRSKEPQRVSPRFSGQHAAVQKPRETPRELMPRHLSAGAVDRFIHVVRTPLGTILALLATFAALWFAIHFLQPYPETRVTNLLTCFTFSASVSFVYWAILWIELIQVNPIMAVASVLFPPAVGSVVAAHPENTKYSYGFHLVALAIATVFYYYTKEMTDLSPFEHFEAFNQSL